MAVRAVFFDLYNTLAGFHPAREQLQAGAAATHGLVLTPEGTVRGYHDADAFMNKQNRTRPLRSMSREEQSRFFAEYERRVLAGSGHQVDLDLAERIWNTVREQEYRLQLFPDAIPALDLLRGTGLRIGIISNMNRPGEDLGRDLGLRGHVDLVVTSLDARAEKPAAAIFLAALDRAGVQPAEAVHVGDQLESDIAGAEAVGMRGILIDRYGNYADHRAHPRIAGLDELPGLISRLT